MPSLLSTQPIHLPLLTPSHLTGDSQLSDPFISASALDSSYVLQNTGLHFPDSLLYWLALPPMTSRTATSNPTSSNGLSMWSVGFTDRLQRTTKALMVSIPWALAATQGSCHSTLYLHLFLWKTLQAISSALLTNSRTRLQSRGIIYLEMLTPWPHL